MLTGGTNNNAKGQTTAKIYNIGTSSWSNARAMNQKRLFHGCTSVTLDDGSVMGVVVGGYSAWPSSTFSLDFGLPGLLIGLSFPLLSLHIVQSLYFL